MTGPLTLIPTTSATVPFVVQAAAAQTADLLRVLDSTAAEMLAVDAAGSLRMQTLPVSNSHTFLRAEAFTSTLAPVGIVGTGAWWSGIEDPIIRFGYNPAGLLPNHPILEMNIEGNWNDGSGQNKMEWYVQYYSTNTLTIYRPFYAQINKVADTAIIWVAGETINFTKTAGATKLSLSGNIATFGDVDTLSRVSGLRIVSTDIQNHTLVIDAPSGASAGIRMLQGLVGGSERVAWATGAGSWAGMVTTGQGGFQFTKDSGYSKAAGVGLCVPGGAQQDDMVFYTYSSPDPSWLERMRMTNGGLFGIGTTPSNARLHVMDATVRNTSGGIIVSDSTAQAAGVGGQLLFELNYTNAGGKTRSAGLGSLRENGTTGDYSTALTFATALNGGTLTEKLRVTAAGVLAVGGGAPGGSAAAGEIELTTTAKGIILRSPDGTRYRVTVANGGALTTAAA